MVERAGTNPIPPELLALARRKVEPVPIEPAPLADRIEYLPTQDHSAVSATASQAKSQEAPPMDKKVQFREKQMLVIASAQEQRYQTVTADTKLAEKVFGYRDLLVGPDVNQDVMKEELRKLLERPDAGAVVKRILGKVSEVCERANTQGDSACVPELEGEDFAWLFKAVDPKVAGTYVYLKAVESMLTPVEMVLNHPEDVKGRQKALIDLHETDPFMLLASMQGHLQKGDMDLIEMQIMVKGLDGRSQNLSGINRMIMNDFAAVGGMTRDLANRNPATLEMQALDRARGRVFAAAGKHPADFEKFKALFDDKIMSRRAGALNPEDLALLRRLGFEYDKAENSLSVKDAKGQKHLLDKTALQILNEDVTSLGDIEPNPAMAAYLGKVREVMIKTGILEQATAELEQLMAQSRLLRQEHQNTQSELAGVDELKQRLANGGSLQQGDMAMLHKIDPDLSLKVGADGKFHAFRNGQPVSDAELQALVASRRQQLQARSEQEERKIAELDHKIDHQRQRVATAKSDLEQSMAEADQAFRGLSPDEQRKMAGLHGAVMRQAETAVNQADRVLRALDDFIAEFGLGAMMSAPPQSGVAQSPADPAEADVGPLAAQPQANQPSTAQSSADAQEKAAEYRTEINQQRQQQLNGEIQERAMTAFLDRIQDLRRELVEETDERALEMQDERSQELDGLA
ncbi:MAG: hypothetical protein ACAI44_22130 [Candidatus Sericytochromatia bacterium]